MGQKKRAEEGKSTVQPAVSTVSRGGGIGAKGNMESMEEEEDVCFLAAGTEKKTKNNRSRHNMRIIRRTNKEREEEIDWVERKATERVWKVDGTSLAQYQHDVAKTIQKEIFENKQRGDMKEAERQTIAQGKEEKATKSRRRSGDRHAAGSETRIPSAIWRCVSSLLGGAPGEGGGLERGIMNESIAGKRKRGSADKRKGGKDGKINRLQYRESTRSSRGVVKKKPIGSDPDAMDFPSTLHLVYTDAIVAVQERNGPEREPVSRGGGRGGWKKRKVTKRQIER
ncbi:hypothetical protein ZHAS_00002148 [Anopheles sinensis]|uniref:Uncharacterized protein n=1 Tax=Anopheles sinensis TaxID=74873 RepID=A0A084VBV2_ANOSI|nr:hypothetical protein ZHAS_00002148 [Anopheles sinensis]